MITLIQVYERTVPGFEVVAANSFIMTVARIIVYQMMHLNVEPEIRNGIFLANYCINHPDIFRNSVYADERGKRRINVMAVLPPFSLAMGQIMSGIIVEISVLIYLTSLDDLLFIIMRFVALCAICKFDDMYASALPENKMKSCGGKKLHRRYFKHMQFMYQQWKTKYKFMAKDVDDLRLLEEAKSDCSIPDYNPLSGVDLPYGYINGEPFFRNPRADSFVL